MPKNDLLHRYSGYSFTETVVGDMVKVEFKDGEGNVVESFTKMEALDAYNHIRDALLGNHFIPCLLTLTERSALTSSGIPEGFLVEDYDTGALYDFDSINNTWRAV